MSVVHGTWRLYYSRPGEVVLLQVDQQLAQVASVRPLEAATDAVRDGTVGPHGERLKSYMPQSPPTLLGDRSEEAAVADTEGSDCFRMVPRVCAP